MKKLIFILLKIAEISLLPIAYCLFTYIGWFLVAYIRYILHGEVFAKNPHNFGFEFFLFGTAFSGILFLIIIFIIHVLPDLFDEWIESNEEWSQNIVNWLKRVKEQ